MKRFLLGLLLAVAAASYAGAQAESKLITATGGTVQFNNPNGYTSATFEEVPTPGSPGTASITVQGCMRATTCDSAADTNAGLSAAIRGITFLKAYNYFLVTATFSGGTATGYTINSQLGQLPASGASGSTLVTQPTGTNLHVVTDATSTASDVMSGTVPGTAPSNAELVAAIFNSAAPALTTGQTAPLQTDSSGSLMTTYRTPSCVNGGNGTLSSVALNASTTSAVQVIALSAGKKIMVCAITVIGGGTAPTFSLVYGTGTNCATGQVVLTGAIPLSLTVPTSFPGPVAVTIASNALCILLAGTTPTAVGVLSYTQ